MIDFIVKYWIEFLFGLIISGMGVMAKLMYNQHLKNKAIDKRADLTEEEENAVVLKEIKQCQEAIDTAPAGREDVIQENTARIAVYQEFAPRMMDRDEIAAVVDQVLAELNLSAPTAKEKGLIMKTLMPRVKGKADSALVNQVLTSRLQ